MAKPLISLIAVGAMSALSACGGGGGGGGISLADYASLNAATDLNEFAQNTIVNNATDTLNYSGFVNIGPDTGGSALVGFIGELSVAVNFDTDNVSGGVSNFGRWTDAGASGVAPPVSGSLAINGALTGTNETLSDGISGTAVGTVDGYNFNMIMDGNILGSTSRSGVVLYFDNIGDLGGGVGIATR